MRDNVDILEKYIENLEVKKNLLQTTIEAYKLDINEYLEFLKERNAKKVDDNIQKRIKEHLLWLDSAAN